MDDMVVEDFSFEAALALPQDVTVPGPWAGHIPFAHWIIATLKPALVVELGTYKGNSYLNFCQSIVEHDVKSKAFAIDTWQGDTHSGYYGEEILAELKSRHDPKYASFSTLVRSSFDDAVKKFEDGSIDLLHIDGLHTYEAVRNDFFNWFPKLSERAVVLFHDTNVHQMGFGVYKFWEEISQLYPSFNFLHSNGLGVLAVGGDNCPTAILRIAEGREGDYIRSYAFKLFSYLGKSIENSVQLISARDEISEIRRFSAEKEALVSTLRKENEEIISTLSKKDSDQRKLQDSLGSELKIAEMKIKALQDSLGSELKIAEMKIEALQNSTSWKITYPLRKLSIIARRGQRAIKLISRGEVRPLYHSLKARLPKNNVGNQPSTSFDKSREKLLAEKTLANVKTVTIVTTDHTIFVANLVARELSAIGITTDVTTVMPPKFGSDLYIVICAQMFSTLPPPLKRIIFQMEQSVSSRWFNADYIDILKNSLAVFDYSIKNLSFLEEKGLGYPKTYYVPISCLPHYDKWLGENESDVTLLDNDQYDVLFYGDIRNERRSLYITELKKHFRVKVINDSFGAEIRQAIRRAKVVVNIHYYEDALLETTRICECLSLGTKVISEIGSDQSEHSSLDDLVKFVNVGDVPGMIEAINLELNGSSYDVDKQLIHENSKTFSVMFHRALFDLGLISYNQFCELIESTTFTEDTYFLSLPETPNRRSQFINEMPYLIKPFNGLRQRPGWMGTAYSYKFLARKAMDAGKERLLVYEDDVEFKKGHIAQLGKINRFLNQLDPNEWDVFSGFIGDLHADCRILDVIEFEGTEYIKIDKIVSAVCNIYNSKALKLLSEWSNINSDSATDTIDRYLERINGLTSYTTLPFLVGHRDDAESTLWGAHNSSMIAMINRSEELLAKKIAEFKAQKL
ncbi:class I SAM-dependent methyltransferase [Brucella thiophenivorans]|uniref:Methyltransferase domain protein n=1 Tax=Brucella thiophenivorans TaxID=571255 RepID=A0A256G7P5_9HYPH|nr:class I SAM-dependent methyltransferase [Brucella thiophenivorans]OYR22976.1 methyltransferase domain protein [Brucella thiophenivorans]